MSGGGGFRCIHGRPMRVGCPYCAAEARGLAEPLVSEAVGDRERGAAALSNAADPEVIARMIREAAAWQNVERIGGRPLLTDEALGRKMGVSATWVARHVPPEQRRTHGQAPKRPRPITPIAMAEATAIPEPPGATEPAKPKLSYAKGVSCGRGKHTWVDHGGYFKCSSCNSTKTKRAPKAPAAEGEGSTQPLSLLIEPAVDPNLEPLRSPPAPA